MTRFQQSSARLLCLLDFGSGPEYEDATSMIWNFFEVQW
jgi:hypothetical protein